MVRPPKLRDLRADRFASQRGDLERLAQGMTGCRSVAEDIVQESWLRLQRTGYTDEDAPSVLPRIVRNLVYDWLRRRRRERRAFEDIRLDRVAPDVETVAINREELSLARDAIDALPERTRRAFLMSRIEGMTYAEIGRQLGISAPRAHQLVHQALSRIALHLDR